MKLEIKKNYARHCESYLKRIEKKGKHYQYYHYQLRKTLQEIKLMELGLYEEPEKVTFKREMKSSKSPNKIAEKYFDQYTTKKMTLKEIAEQEGVVLSSLGKAFHRLKNLQPA